MSTLAPATRRLRPIAVGLALVAAIAPWLWLGTTIRAAAQVTIQVVDVDLAGGHLTITGTGFDNPQDTTVYVAGQPVPITSETSTSIVADLPSTVAAGDSVQVEVIVTSGSSRSDEFDLTIPNDDALQAEIDDLQGQGDALDTRITGLEALLAGATRGTDAVTGVDTLVLSGINLQVINGSGSTDGSPNGAGNVILGYNTPGFGDKTGSHFLVVGDGHTYTTTSGIVSGKNHVAQGQYPAVVGGTNNAVLGDFGAILGGVNNVVDGLRAFIGGGQGNVAAGDSSFVGGGGSNVAGGDLSAVAGGEGNSAQGDRSFIGGGTSQTAPSECARIANTNVNC